MVFSMDKTSYLLILEILSFEDGIKDGFYADRIKRNLAQQVRAHHAEVVAGSGAG